MLHRVDQSCSKVRDYFLVSAQRLWPWLIFYRRTFRTHVSGANVQPKTQCAAIFLIRQIKQELERERRNQKYRQHWARGTNKFLVLNFGRNELSSLFLFFRVLFFFFFCSLVEQVTVILNVLAIRALCNWPKHEQNNAGGVKVCLNWGGHWRSVLYFRLISCMMFEH